MTEHRRVSNWDAPDPVAIVAHDFPLRPDLVIRVVLPRHLTGADAERLIGFVRSLAFSPATTGPGGSRMTIPSEHRTETLETT